MSAERGSAGFTLVEALLGIVLLTVVLTGIGGLMLDSARLNSSQQMKARVLANARTTLSLVVQRLRGAGWDPQNSGIQTVVLDPLGIDADLSDGVDNLVTFADLNADSETDGTVTDDDDNEQVLIRHNGDRIEWQTKPGNAFIALAVNISNDSDGDGTIEPMFVPNSVSNPSRITVRVTAVSPAPDPVTKNLIRYTVESDVVLRKSL